MAKLNIRNRNRDQCGKDGKPKPPNWEYRFEAAKVDGKRRSISKAGFRTKKEAEVAGAKALAEYANAGLMFEPSSMSFADYLDYWFANYVSTKCRHNTQSAYYVIITHHLKPALGKYRLRSLTPMILQDYINAKSKSGLKRSTIGGVMCVLTSSLKYAVYPAQLLQASPAAYLTYPKVEDDRAECNRYIISVQDFRRMMERFPPGNPFRYALLIGFYTGLRIGEAHALAWSDIDFQAGTLTVNKQVYVRKHAGGNGDNATWYFTAPKTSSSVRTIQIGETLMRELREYRAMQLSNRLEYGEYYTLAYLQPDQDERGNKIHRLVCAAKSEPVALPEIDLVLRKPNGQYSSKNSFHYAVRVIQYELHIQFNFHSLRHTHATKLIESGISPKVVQARLGHDSIETTMQTYVHNTMEMEQQAVAAFEAAASSI